MEQVCSPTAMDQNVTIIENIIVTLYLAILLLRILQRKEDHSHWSISRIGKHLAIQLAQLEAKYALSFNLSLLELHVYL